MIFADKIIRLRKKNGWSQEELAEKMNVSRQSISKWEGAQAVPDIGKILQLSVLFGVTTDYLLKDEIENEEYSGENDDSAARRVSLAEAGQYLEQRKKASVRIAIATFLCILSPIPLILLGAASEIPTFGIFENAAAAIGLISLFAVVALAVVIYTLCGFHNAPYEFLEKEYFEIEYGVKGMVKEKQAAYRKTYVQFNIIGTCLCILAPIPLFIGAFAEKKFLTVIMLAVTMLIAGIGVSFFINAGVRMASFRRILKESGFSEKEKEKNRVTETISSIYWLLTVALYLGICFTTNDWKTSWIVWPIAGVLYAAVIAICKLVTEKNKMD